MRVVKSKDTNEVFAMKKLNKHDMVKKNQVVHVRAERDILTQADKNWIVDLKYSF